MKRLLHIIVMLMLCVGVYSKQAKPLPERISLEIPLSNEGDELIVSPNPATSFIQIKTAKNKKIVQVSIFTTLGNEVLNKKILEKKSTRLNVNGLRKGRYFVRVVFKDNSSLTSTIIKV